MFSWALIAEVLAGIILVFNFISWIRKGLIPAVNLRDTIQKHEEELEELQKHERNDVAAFQQLDQRTKALCECTLCMMNHMIDGNHVDQMKKTRDKTLELLSNM